MENNNSAGISACCPARFPMIIKIAAIAAIIYLDQLTKWLIITYLPEGGLPIINGVLRFTYVENTGAAFGILSEHRWLFISISAVAIAGMLWFLFVRKPESRLLGFSLVLLVGGGVGNMIDRVLLGYVIDFIDFHAFPGIWVWVFNVADTSITIGAGLLALYLITSTIDEARAAKAAATGRAPEENTRLTPEMEKTQESHAEDENSEADGSSR